MRTALGKSLLSFMSDYNGKDSKGWEWGLDGAWYVGKLADPAKANMMREKAEE